MNILTPPEAPIPAKIAEKISLGSFAAGAIGIVVEFTDSITNLNQVSDAANEYVIQGSVAAGVISGIAAVVLSRNLSNDS